MALNQANVPGTSDSCEHVADLRDRNQFVRFWPLPSVDIKCNLDYVPNEKVYRKHYAYRGFHQMNSDRNNRSHYYFLHRIVLLCFKVLKVCLFLN